MQTKTTYEIVLEPLGRDRLARRMLVVATDEAEATHYAARLYALEQVTRRQPFNTDGAEVSIETMDRIRRATTAAITEAASKVVVRSITAISTKQVADRTPSADAVAKARAARAARQATR
jgi:hypothetical protein